ISGYRAALLPSGGTRRQSWTPVCVTATRYTDATSANRRRERCTGCGERSLIVGIRAGRRRRVCRRYVGFGCRAGCLGFLPLAGSPPCSFMDAENYTINVQLVYIAPLVVAVRHRQHC